MMYAAILCFSFGACFALWGVLEMGYSKFKYVRVEDTTLPPTRYGVHTEVDQYGTISIVSNLSR